MQWTHKDLLDIAQLCPEEILHILDTAERFAEINTRPIKKAPILKGKSVVLFFAEPSTRTKMSFDMAAKRLSADSFAIGAAGSSLQKGESLKDTVRTLQAMRPDAIVIRHRSSGAAAYVAGVLDCSIINAGDGQHAHPTQALLDAFTLRHAWKDAMEGKVVCILGDIAHSRVARSNVELLTRLGVVVRLCGPRTLLPPGVTSWPVEVFHDPGRAIIGAHAVMCLRLQLERQQAGLLPSLAEYSRTYGLTRGLLAKAAPDAIILHPGPMNRGVEIADVLADCPSSRILDQVFAGVAVRMAVLHLLLTRKA